MNKEHKYKDKDEYKDNDKDKHAERTTESLTVCLQILQIQTLTQILLCGEKPHLSDKYTHNKFIAFAVQAFILKTKRLIAYNKPNAPPTHGSD